MTPAEREHASAHYRAQAALAQVEQLQTAARQVLDAYQTYLNTDNPHVLHDAIAELQDVTERSAP